MDVTEGVCVDATVPESRPIAAGFMGSLKPGWPVQLGRRSGLEPDATSARSLWRRLSRELVYCCPVTLKPSGDMTWVYVMGVNPRPAPCLGEKDQGLGALSGELRARGRLEWDSLVFS